MLFFSFFLTVYWPQMAYWTWFAGLHASQTSRLSTSVSIRAHSCWWRNLSRSTLGPSVNWATSPSPVVGWCRLDAQLLGEALGLVLPQPSTEWPSCCGRLSLPGNVSLLSARRGSVMTPLLWLAAPTSRLQHRPHFAGFFHSDSQLPCSSGLVGCAPLVYCLQFAGLHTSRTSLCLICRPASECYPACSAGSLFGIARFLQGCTASGVPTQQLVSYASSPYSAPGILGSGPGHPRPQLGILGEHARGLVLANRLCFLAC